MLCVVLIFECILLQCEFAKDIISLDFSSFYLFFTFCLLVYFVPELRSVLFRKLKVNGEFDIMLIFYIFILNIIVILFHGFEFTVKY